MTTATEVRELAHRSHDGVDVTLLWHAGTTRVSVVVRDDRAGSEFEVDVDGAAALDAFNHPFAYEHKLAA